MKSWKIHLWTRKIHRYLGLILGIQFLMWTLGGLYFSWVNIEEVRGEHLIQDSPEIFYQSNDISPLSILEQESIDSAYQINLVSILNQTYYQIHFYESGTESVKLFDAQNGTLKQPITSSEATQIAKAALVQQAEPTQNVLIEETSAHHEYRGGRLPAYIITFDEPIDATVYVSKDLGTVQKVRTNAWRVFDFLWMLHTMDYQERDNFNNWLLKAFSLFGIFTISSGFLLFFLSSRRLRRR